MRVDRVSPMFEHYCLEPPRSLSLLDAIRWCSIQDTRYGEQRIVSDGVRAGEIQGSDAAHTGLLRPKKKFSPDSVAYFGLSGCRDIAVDIMSSFKTLFRRH